MKNIAVILFVLLSATVKSQSANYHPFPDSAAYWCESNWWIYSLQPPCTVQDDYCLFINGDTAIGTHTYHKLYASGFIGASCPPPGYNYYDRYSGAFRQDTAMKRVYYVPVSATGDTLLYDFNLSMGDTLLMSYNNGSGNVVIGIDSVLVGGNYHKRYLLSPLSQPTGPDSNYALIEGVGSTLGFYWPIEPWFEGGSQLNCFSNDGQYYPWNSNCDFDVSVGEINAQLTGITIYPNPLSEQTTLKSETILESAMLTIYNSFGQVVREINDVSGQTIVITRGDLLAGVYYLQLVNNGVVSGGTLVINP